MSTCETLVERGGLHDTLVGKRSVGWGNNGQTVRGSSSGGVRRPVASPFTPITCRRRFLAISS